MVRQMPRVYRDARAVHIKLPAANRYSVNFRVEAKSVVPGLYRGRKAKDIKKKEMRTNRRRRGAWNDLWVASWTLDTRMCQNLVVEGISLVASSPPCEENATQRISGPTCTSRRPRWEDGYPCVSPMTPTRKKKHTFAHPLHVRRDPRNSRGFVQLSPYARINVHRIRSRDCAADII